MEKIKLQTVIDIVKMKLSDISSAGWIDAVCTNSREVAELTAAGHHVLFVPIVGERVDAHRFLPDVRDAGAVAAFASSAWLGTEAGQSLAEAAGTDPSQTFTLIEVQDTLTALQTLAAWYRGLFTIPVIGITGSVGKTTTKEMVAAALESALTVHKTAGNQNSQIGLPLTIFGLEHRHEAAVIEMGMSEFGEMSRIAAVARPDHAIMTNIGVAHIGNLGSQENIRSEKLHITDHFHEGSTLLLNADDALLAETGRHVNTTGAVGAMDAADTAAVDILLYGESEMADFRATDIRVQGTGQEFLLHYPGGEPKRIRLQVLGMHNVRNALAALAIAWKLGIPPETSAVGLASYAPLSMRGNLIEHNGIRILDDSYNASPDSMKSSIEVLSSLPEAKHRIVVFADVLELGDRSEDLHREVGAFLAEYNHRIATAGSAAAKGRQPVCCLLTVGPESLHIERGYLDRAAELSGRDPQPAPLVECRHFTDNAAAAAYLKSILTTGDAVLIKGSRGMKTDEIVAALQQ